jgi:hypothetical protein
MASNNTQLWDRTLAGEGRQSSLSSGAPEELLYRYSPIGELSPFLCALNVHTSTTYHRIKDCFAIVWFWGSGFEAGQMLRIQRTANGEVLFTLSGRIDAENLAELEALIGSEPKNGRIVLDLKDLTLVDREAVAYLERLEFQGMKLMNCPLYIRDWIFRERNKD